MTSSRALLVASCLCVVALSTSSCAPPEPQSSSTASSTAPLFNNGGFETGDLTSWVRGTNLNSTGLAAVPPTSIGDLQLANGGKDFISVKTNAVPESQLPAGLVAGTNVPMWPRFGTSSVVLNEWASTTPAGDTFHQGANRNVNHITQSFTTATTDIDSSDGKVHVRFVLAPVLEAAGHVPTQQPYFFAIVSNATRNQTIYTNFNFANQTGVPWTSQGSGDTALLFTPWQIFDIAADDSQLTIGENIQVQVFAAGCQPRGHSGSVYIDGFGAKLPSLAISKTAPAQANIDSDITYTFTVQNNTSGIAPNVVADEVLPPNTTFVSYSAPGATCTTPAVGATGTVSCTYGWMNPGASSTFTVTVHAFAPVTQGTVTGATNARIDDGAQTWGVNAYQGYTVYVTSGAQANQQSVITTNTATRLNFSPNLPGTPANGSTFAVINPPAFFGTATGGSGTTLVRTGSGWADNQWTGYNVVILSGTGSVATRRIESNDATTLTVSGWPGANPNNTSVFAITLPVTNVVNGNYGISGPTVSRLLGPKRETAISTGLVFADLQIVKTNSVPAVRWSNPTTYTITVSNVGPSNATNATVADTLPAQISSASWTCVGTGGGTCAASGMGSINQSVNVPAGGSVTFTVTANIGAGVGLGSVTNLATVTAPAGVVDPFSANNSSSDTDAIAATLRLLTVTKDPLSTGTGTVTSLPAAINCGSACSTQGASFADTQVVTLTAVASPNNRFMGWGGACASAGTAMTCTLTMDAAKNVTALFSSCGNGVLETGEGCDDNNVTNGDGCSSSCLVENTFSCNTAAPGLTGNSSCASGVCDAVGNVAPGKCEAANTCGNGTREAGEGCDDGNTANADGCSSTCLVENTFSCNASAPGLTGNSSCASGVCDAVGNAAPGKCEAANTCGNGTREAGEGCDDGNVTNGDGCNSTCKVENTFSCNASAPGLTGNSSCASGVCDAVGNAAPGKCEAANTCGNGTREAGEGCDDGNTANADGCSSTCLVENTFSCNASAPGLTGNSSCVSGVCDAVGNVAPGKCEAANTCGNGTREAGEGCDDGNVTNGDGCNSTCKIENTFSCNASAPGLTGNTSCASGVCDAVGNAAPGKCEAANTCGNGTREAGEGCDDGNTANADGCSSTCLVENTFSCNASAPGLTGNSSCVSGVCDAVGNVAPGKCEAANTCGNGTREAGEGCDDGNVVNGDGCNSTCKVENTFTCNASAPGLTGNTSCASGVCDAVGNAAPGKCEAANTCGNGTREAGEGCDDGNTANADGCSSTCLVENTFSCNASAPGLTGNSSCVSGVCDAVGNVAPGKCEAANTCGNGTREAGEGCDDGNVANADGCSSTCLVENTFSCNASAPGLTGATSCASGVCDTVGNAAPGKCEAANTCGNGTREASEGCDDGNTANGDGCSSACLVENTFNCNASAPGFTGNSSCASGVCDAVGNAAPGKCEAANTCGNGTREAGEGCDDGNVVNGDGCNSTCKVENTFTCNASAPGLTGNTSCASGVCDAVGNAAPGKCEAANTCGNGTREAGEGCDDGNTASNDGCSAACLVENTFSCNASAPGLTGNSSCVSGVCDAVGNAAPGKCEAANTCGNGTREAGEGCDDGNVTNGDGCNSTCKVENTFSCNASAPGLTGATSCASGVCDTLGNTAPGKCEAANTCGNGTREAGEGCDDGNTANNDGCSSTCRIENGGTCNASAPGLTGSSSCVSGICDTVGNAAPGKCEAANSCGNGVREAGEGCDDGNVSNGDGCNSSCLVENGGACNAAGPGVTGASSCASGVCDATGNAAPGVCEPATTCGNGTREAGEGCDDGNTTAGDGCSAACLIENTQACNASGPGLTGNASCVSGLCDTVNHPAPGVCKAANVCGNGIREAGEGCDDGGTTAGDGCSATCLVENGGACNATGPGATGNDSCQSGRCDTVGNAAPGICEPATGCGNGLREATEGCDDGNTTAGDGCSASCLIETAGTCNVSMPGLTGASSCASGVCDTTGNAAPGKCEAANACGNGTREAGEGCDDGNTTAGDGCSATCLVENGGACNASMPGATGGSSCASGVCDATGNAAPGVCETANACGNGAREAGEGCDDGNTTAGDGCSATCLVENGGACNASMPGVTGSSSCASGVCDATGNAAPGVCEAANVCGNGAREAGEGCDDGNATAGDGCSAMCLVENGRACNDSMPGNVGNASCLSGLCVTANTPAPGVCKAANVCGNGVREAGEGCDDNNTTGGDGCSASCLIENGGTCNAGTPGSTGSDSCQSGRCDTVGNASPGKCEAANACGNGKVDSNEGCDDGNTASGDGCNASCLVENGAACNRTGGRTGNASCASGTCQGQGNGTCTGGTDTDGDGVDDTADLDDDNDGISDVAEGGPDTDTDGDGVPDRLDLDSDNDGILDAWEAGHTQGVADNGTVSCTGNFGSNGFCNAVETSSDSGNPGYTLADTDGDGVPDFRDLDSDDDGLYDLVEGSSTCVDSARDGICDGGDRDRDGVLDDVDAPGSQFGVTSTQAPPDADGDGVADFRDLDSDDDGLSDLIEGSSGCTDADANAVCDGTDTDHDGLKSTVDGTASTRGGFGGTQAPDTDGDGLADFRDLDSDGDALSDLAEGKAACADDNRNGVCDGTDTDKDGLKDGADGAPSTYGSGPSATPGVPDTDGDGQPDYRDVDSDNDGQFDIIGAGRARLDANGDGRIDDQTDADRDGIADSVDQAKGEFGGLPPPPGIKVIGGGCGCGSTDVGSTWFLLGAAFVGHLALRRTRRGRTAGHSSATANRRPYAARLVGGVGAALVLAVLAIGPQASAQTSSALDVQLLKPGPGRYDIFNVLSAKTCGAGCMTTGLWLQYTRNPLLIADLKSSERIGVLVDHQLTADVLQSWGITDRISIGLHLPVYLQHVGASDLVNPKYVGEGWAVGAGDLRLIPRIRLWTSDFGLSLGLAVPVVIPTARLDSFMGGGFIGAQPRVLAGLHRGGLSVDANVGFNLRRFEQLSNVRVGHEFAWALGAAYRFDKVPVAAQAAVHGVVGLSGGGSLAGSYSTEIDVGGVAYLNRSWSVGLTLGRGIISGVGAPDLRVAANMTYTLECLAPAPAAPADTDGDGIVDSADKCPTQREDKDGFQDEDGCPDPDNDDDGIKDELDKCPLVPESHNGVEDQDGCPEKDSDGDGLLDAVDKCPNAPEDKDGFEDSDGCPDPDNDNDGIKDVNDKCPNEAEDKDGFEDQDGCPDPDNDKDGILDAADKCPMQPETINGVEDTDGCPDQGESKVKLEGDKILILEKVYFATGKDVILERSFNLLTQVASTLQAHPELKKIRIEGHTDSQGNEAANLDLSQRRATSVLKFLVEQGVESKRLVAVGYGQTKPVGNNLTAQGREMNRRVEFVVVDADSGK